jgi:hypothetical protein
MAAVVASKLKRQRQSPAEAKGVGDPPYPADFQLTQRKAAEEAVQKRKLSQYYNQVKGQASFSENNGVKFILKLNLSVQIHTPIIFQVVSQKFNCDFRKNLIPYIVPTISKNQILSNRTDYTFLLAARLRLK